MKGHVDQEMRALLSIRIGKRNATPEMDIYAWLDTAFNGTLVLPKNVAVELGLPVESIAEAILANGELVELETCGCSIHWLGKVYDTQVVTNESEYGLIGTGLLVDRIITVDYKAKTVSVD
jgi:clan AA aspartic protease